MVQIIEAGHAAWWTREPMRCLACGTLFRLERHDPVQFGTPAISGCAWVYVPCPLCDHMTFVVQPKDE